MQEEKPEGDGDEPGDMEGVEEDVTLTGEPFKADIDALLVSSPSVPADDQPSKEAKEETSSHGRGADDDDKEDGVPHRELRSRKPVIEPIEIPTAVAARRVKGRKRMYVHSFCVAGPNLVIASDSTTHASTRSSKRRGATETSKAPHSPGTASAAGTFDSAPTPAGATDENASVAEDDSTAVRKSTRSKTRSYLVHCR
jgi:cell division protein FtsN